MLRHILLALGTRLSSGKRCGMNAVGRKLQTNGVIPLWSLRGAVDVQVKDVDAVLAVGVCKEIDKILTHKGYAKVGPFDRPVKSARGAGHLVHGEDGNVLQHDLVLEQKSLKPGLWSTEVRCANVYSLAGLECAHARMSARHVGI